MVRSIPVKGNSTAMKMHGGAAEMESKDALEALLPRTPMGTARNLTFFLREVEKKGRVLRRGVV